MSDFAAGFVFGFSISCAVLGSVVLWFTLQLRAVRDEYVRFFTQQKEGEDE